MRSAQPFSLAVFDVAGTTVMDGDAVVACMKAALDARVGVSWQDVYDVMGLPKPIAIGQLLSSRGGLRGDALREAVEETHRAFRAAMIDRYRSDESIAPAPGAVQVFSALRGAAVRVALDTGFSRDILDAILQRLAWIEGRTIDFTIASDEVPRGRPHPDMIQYAMSLAGVADRSAVVKIGDTPADMMQGLSAGCGLVVGVTYGTHTRAQLEREGVTIIDSLPDLLPLVGVASP